MTRNTEDTVAVPQPLTRAEKRAKMFAPENTVRKVERINFLGQDLEFRQPGVDDFLNMQSDESGRHFMVRMLIQFAYFPGSDEKAFEETDYDQLMALPMSGSFTSAINVIQKLLDLKVEDKVKN